MRQRIGKDEIGGLHLGAVVERRRRDAIAHLGHRARARGDRRDPAASPAPTTSASAGRRIDCRIGGAVSMRENLGAVVGPLAVVGNRQERIVADRRPHQAAGSIGEARDRIPGRGRALRDAEPQPAVPRQILELDGPQRHRRVQAGLRVEGDVLDAVGELVAVESRGAAGSRSRRARSLASAPRSARVRALTRSVGSRASSSTSSR